jgi:hypothetical protein
MKHSQKPVVSVLRCKDGVVVPIKQSRVVDAIRERDERISQLNDKLLRAQVAVGEEVKCRRELLDGWWVRLGIALRLVKP